MRAKTLIIPFPWLGLASILVSTSEGQRPGQDSETARVLRGFQIAPVR